MRSRVGKSKQTRWFNLLKYPQGRQHGVQRKERLKAQLGASTQAQATQEIISLTERLRTSHESSLPKEPTKLIRRPFCSMAKFSCSKLLMRKTTPKLLLWSRS